MIATACILQRPRTASQPSCLCSQCLSQNLLVSSYVVAKAAVEHPHGGILLQRLQVRHACHHQRQVVDQGRRYRSIALHPTRRQTNTAYGVSHSAMACRTILANATSHLMEFTRLKFKQQNSLALQLQSAQTRVHLETAVPRTLVGTLLSAARDTPFSVLLADGQ